MKNSPEAPSVFYESYVCSESFAEDRLCRIAARIPKNARGILDIGCGQGRNLRFLHQNFPEAKLSGTDISHASVDVVRSLGFDCVSCDASEYIPYPDASFDVVICGEVIEHVVNTDRLLYEIRRVLQPNGKLLLTTPNLAYAVNRVLLLFGVQPIFTETSLYKNLGRGFRFLGQGRDTQGHLKIFTAGAVKEILRETGYTVTHFEGYRAFQSGALGAIDSVLRIRPELAAGFIAEAIPTDKGAATSL